jgi:Tfp pilus assembly protein PilE
MRKRALAPFFRSHEIKRFTIVEMLVTIIVLSAIVAIVLPMHAVRAGKLDLVRAKAQLVTIKESQDRYRTEHGTYTTDVTKLVNWKTSTKQYRFRVEYADRSRFRAEAIGHGEAHYDPDGPIWAIDQSGTLTQVK